MGIVPVDQQEVGWTSKEFLFSAAFQGSVSPQVESLEMSEWCRRGMLLASQWAKQAANTDGGYMKSG